MRTIASALCLAAVLLTTAALLTACARRDEEGKTSPVELLNAAG